MTDDDQAEQDLEQRLRRSLHDPVPDAVVRMSEQLFTWRTVDAELAELELAELAGAGVRGDDDAAMTFLVGDRVIEAELDPERHALVVDLGGAWASEIELLTPQGSATPGSIDQNGVCSFVDPPQGPVQLVITRADGSLVKTRWVTL